MADYAPVYGGNATIKVTLTAGAAITGGQCLVITADNTVSPSGAAATAFVGVAAEDAASGAPVTVHCGGAVHETASTGAIAAGGAVMADAAGVVKANSGTAIGIALKAAAGNVCRWLCTA